MSDAVASFEELAESVRLIVGAAPDDARQVVFGYWVWRQRDNFPPAAIASPEEFTGGDRLNIACTQTDLPPRQQKALVDRWVEVLPTLRSVRTLWFSSRVSQELFEAACSLQFLEGLYLKWNGIREIDAIGGLKELRFLHLGTSSSVVSLAPLSKMHHLEWLQIDGPIKAFVLDPIAELTGLVGLGFTGVEGKKHKVPSLAPLEALQNLRWLHLGAVHVEDGSLRPLAKLKHLEWLGLGNHFPVEEFARLSIHLPETRCEWLSAYAKSHKSVFPCRECGKNWKVMTSGRGHQLLCPTCDNIKLAKHIMKFNAAVVAARACVF